ncbi:hypothetical protein N657DRAFT_650963 [Parathielavia appendiculata]|uniref:Heterokaryon incompatibility domain-containing protein n=1 Tax=Parathielavia appendiculata TaxID=2587402 RepID=A0AAN6TQJ7_9PEZI|nr:hypothetical protein N657DRAFT_650963 [Parathielavia appendiculata]
MRDLDIWVWCCTALRHHPPSKTTTPGLKPYVYKRLENPASNIRLLTVLDVTPTNLICTLREIASPDAEQYDCLSYTWGDPFGRVVNPTPPQKEIRCDGRLLLIGQNLHDALVHLHGIATLRSTLAAIWVDAICINQDKESEKAHQIRMMHKIYASASRVIIWLGPDETDSGDGGVAAELRVVVATMRQELGDSMAAVEARLEELRDGERAEKADLPLIHAIKPDSWMAVRDIISQRAYWLRLWVWQEVMAAKQDPVVVCGQQVMTWEEVRLASGGLTTFGDAAMTRRGRPPPVRNEVKNGDWLAPNLPHTMAWWRDMYVENGADWIKQKFGRLVLSLNRNLYVCWDERDKIYAHLGLCQREQLAKWRFSKSFDKLYLRFWCEVMQRTKEVNFLTFVEDAASRSQRPRMRRDGEKVKELPSWVPDLRCRLEPPSMWDYFQSVECFNVSRGLEASKGLEVFEKQRRMRVWGYRFDRVKRCGETSTEAAERYSLPGIVAMLGAIATSPETPYGSQENAFDAIWTSIAILTDSETDPSFPIPESHKERAMLWLYDAMAAGKVFRKTNTYTQEQERLFHEFVDVGGRELLSNVNQYAQAHRNHLAGMVARVRSPSAAGVDASEPLPALNQQPGTGHIGMAAVAVGGYGLRRMRLFMTEEGWVGKGPESMEHGDEIWIIPGGEVAFVLRSRGRNCRGRNFTYIGHAYVHGIMDGQECLRRFRGVPMTEINLI